MKVLSLGIAMRNPLRRQLRKQAKAERKEYLRKHGKAESASLSDDPYQLYLKGIITYEQCLAIYDSKLGRP